MFTRKGRSEMEESKKEMMKEIGEYKCSLMTMKDISDVLQAITGDDIFDYDLEANRGEDNVLTIALNVAYDDFIGVDIRLMNDKKIGLNTMGKIVDVFNL